MAQSELRIGELAARTGVSIDTVRFYERRRLIPCAVRTGGGFRLFSTDTIERIRFIKQAQDIGLSLEDIGQLLQTGGGANECRSVRDLLSAKLAELDDRMKKMRDFRRTVINHLAACENELKSRGQEAECPVMVNITHHGRSSKTVSKSKEKRI